MPYNYTHKKSLEKTNLPENELDLEGSECAGESDGDNELVSLPESQSSSRTEFGY